MILVFGTKRKFKNLGSLENCHCSRCNNTSDWNFIKQYKNTRDFSREMNCTKILVSIQGNLYVDTEQNRATKKLNCWELLKLV